MGVGTFKTVVPDVNFWKEMVPCQAACPVRTDAGRYVQLIGAGEYRNAYLTARSPNPLASICGRVCAAPCEDKCRRGRIDAPVSIRALKRFVTEKYGAESMRPDTQEDLFAGVNEPGNKERWHLPLLEKSKRRTGRTEKVAVIGAGPAGLSCAHDLALMGYEVTIFEATRQTGGMMFHGIPEFRLPRQIIDKEAEKIQKLGVEIRYGTPLNADGLVRVAGTIALNGPEAFGAAGAALLKFTGGLAYGAAALVAGLLAWTLLPLLASLRLLRKQDI